MNPTRVFIHGLESSSQGTKGMFFRKYFPDMLIDDFSGPLEKRMDRLNKLLFERKDIVLVGSSYGGLMAAIYALNNERKIKKLILLAPALHLQEFKSFLKRKLNTPVTIYHGTHDDVVPFESVHNIAQTIFTNLHYYTVKDDHSLHGTFNSTNWDELLEIKR
jgi:pimeloyl-ACP methyl ester carboxylesterase